MNIFKTKKKFAISERDPSHKVKYLGNVQTALMKGDGCVDKPTNILWNNYTRAADSVGINMVLTICNAGMKAQTEEQGLTEYRAHRISYFIAPPSHPRLLVWVYRHEGKRMKVELRCHAVICKTEERAKAMAVQLHDKLTFSLNEFMRDKTRRQNSRLALQKTQGNNSPTITVNNNNSGINPGVPLRQKMLSTGGKFKPPVERSSTAPKLLMITEDQAGETEQEERDSLTEIDTNPAHTHSLERSKSQESDAESDLSFDPEVHDLTGAVYDLEVGNDIDELKSDQLVQMQMKHSVDSDDNSSESGFSEQDGRENGGGGAEGREEGGKDHGNEQITTTTTTMKVGDNTAITKTAAEQPVNTHL